MVRDNSVQLLRTHSTLLTSTENSVLNNQNHDNSEYRQLLERLQTHKLEPQQALLFATCLIQRMLPNYRVFSENSDFGDHTILSNIVDLFWQKASGLPVKINVENQTLKLMSQMPDKIEYDFFAVNPAIDLCTGIECMLLSLEDKQLNIVEEISLLSRSTVASYLEYVASLDDENPMKFQDSEMHQDSEMQQDSRIYQDPLFQWEVETQLELLSCISESRLDKQLCRQLKQDICAQRLSNLGIEY